MYVKLLHAHTCSILVYYKYTITAEVDRPMHSLFAAGSSTAPAALYYCRVKQYAIYTIGMHWYITLYSLSRHPT